MEINVGNDCFIQLPLILQAKRNASGHIVSTSGMAPGLWENLADTLNFT